jgi:hypothetical protein
MMLLLLKSGGSIVGLFAIKKVSIDNIRNKYQQYLCATDEFWISKNNSNYATLIVIDKIYKLKLFNINKKGMQSWMILN